jgi:hypothetical protein
MEIKRLISKLEYANTKIQVNEIRSKKKELLSLPAFFLYRDLYSRRL